MQGEIERHKKKVDAQENRGRLARLNDMDLIDLDENPKK